VRRPSGAALIVITIEHPGIGVSSNLCPCEPPEDSMSQPEPVSPPTPARAELRDPRRLGVTISVVRPDCFRGDERLRCRDGECRWRSDCCRLVAEWRR
jgi:hypothetical protein